MFNELLESRARPQRRTGVAAASVLAHSAIIVLAVVATTRAAPGPREPTAPPPIFVPISKAPEPVAKIPPSQAVHSAPVPQGSLSLIAPIDVPIAIPPVDLSAPVTRDEDWTGGAKIGRADGVPGLTTPTDAGSPYLASQVEKTVLQAPGSPTPRYPQTLMDAHVEGEVMVQFVVDTTGRVDRESVKIVSSSHDLFTAAVRSALPLMQFLPAEVGERKVKQLVQQPFQFHLKR